MEIWKDINGYEGIYQISNSGKVKSFHHNKETILKSHIGNGYLKVQLKKNNKCKCVYIHRLVAEAFIPNPNNFLEVNHKDECKINNSVSNLEWCNHIYNNNYMNKTQSTKKKTAKLDLNGNILKVYDY